MQSVPAKTIITRQKSTSWFGSEYNMNIYRGCCHGCIYCDSRSDCYRIETFDTVRKKENALKIIRNDLRRKVKKGVVATGAMSDPYNPFEEKELLTRNALVLLDAYGFGVSIATKGVLVTRDIDVLSDIRTHSPTLVKITVTTTDDALAKKLEPNAPSPTERLAALEALSSRGIFCGVLLMPVLPFIQDSADNIKSVVQAAKKSGARFVYPALGMTMRQGQREYFLARLEREFPGMRERYQKRFGTRYTCHAQNIKALWAVFASECERLGLLYSMNDIILAYQLGYKKEQLSLF